MTERLAKPDAHPGAICGVCGHRNDDHPFRHIFAYSGMDALPDIKPGLLLHGNQEDFAMAVLTKREMVAAMVLQGVVAGAPIALHDANMHVDAIDRAEIAVRHADALLARLRAEPETEEGDADG